MYYVYELYFGMVIKICNKQIKRLLADCLSSVATVVVKIVKSEAL